MRFKQSLNYLARHCQKASQNAFQQKHFRVRQCWNTVEMHAKQNASNDSNELNFALLRGIHARIQ